MPVGVESGETLLAMRSGVTVSSGHGCDSGVRVAPHKWGSLPPKWGLCPLHVGKLYGECVLEMLCLFSRSAVTSAIPRRAAAEMGPAVRQ